MSEDNEKEKNKERITFRGRIIEVVETPVEEAPGKIKMYEKARRSPGTRLIIVQNQRVLLTVESRSELDKPDIRLPGGKVFNKLDEYNEFLHSGKDILVPAKQAAIKEAKEEAGIEVNSIRHFHTSINGATVEWDLYYYVIDDYVRGDQELEQGEDIELLEVTFDEAWQYAIDGSMQEDRSAAVLLRYLNEQK